MNGQARDSAQWTADGTWAALTAPPAALQDAVPLRDAVEELDLLTGVEDTATGMMSRAQRGPCLLEFSVVHGRAIFEGDIDLGAAESLTQALADATAVVDENILHAATVSESSRLWPEGRVPFETPAAGSAIDALIDGAVRQVNESTNARFMRRTADDDDYVGFEVAAACSSRVGRSGGRQVVQLSPTATVGNAVHELCHVLGLWHEQSREDRDLHVRIHWNRIRPGFEHNFRQRITDADDVGPYDYASIMHYPPQAFSVDASVTIEPLVPGAEIGQRVALSRGDIDAINVLYPSRSPVEPPKGVQFSVTLPGSGELQVVSGGWHPRRRLHWDVVPLGGPLDLPLVSWQVGVGRAGETELLYFFTIRNVCPVPVDVEVRYVILEEAPA